MKIGFLVNPIAGMGGRVGLKGTDGVVEEALERGAEPIAQGRAQEAIQRYVELIKNQSAIDLKRIQKVEWFTCSGKMGEEILASTGLDKLNNHSLNVVFEPQNQEITNVEDTIQACNKFISEGIDLLVFCGGDGTARDIYSVLNKTVPIL
ncbi:MAG: NAD(+)/NADH kinase, partial [Thermoplasmata archaeon]|nr:NAD(+)/NADH kinase [Thermoplasmata archaeon]